MVEPENIEFVSPVKINSGKKALAHIPFELAALGAEKPLLVTTKTLVKKKQAGKVVDALRASGLTMGIFDGIGERARLDTVMRLRELFQDADFDSVIALGSGAVMDTAKALIVAVTENTRDLAPFALEGDRLIGRTKPYMAIPASSGNGDETTPSAFVDEMVFSSVFLMPDIVVVDPCMVAPEDPMKVISGTMAALTHAVEGVTGPFRNPFVDAYAHTSIRMIAHHFVDAVKQPRQKDSRSALVCAEAMAGCAFSNVKPGLAHLLGKAVEPEAVFPAGICMGILLPHVLGFTAARADFFVDELMLPVAGPETFAITSSELRVGKTISLLQELQFDLYETTDRKLPMTLEDVGIKEDKLEKAAADVAKSNSFGVNLEVCLMLLKQAFKGDPIAFN